jgi:hypothetical protein
LNLLDSLIGAMIAQEDGGQDPNAPSSKDYFIAKEEGMDQEGA